MGMRAFHRNQSDSRRADRKDRKPGRLLVVRAARSIVEMLESRQLLDGMPGPDMIAPTALITASDVTAAGGANTQVVVTYDDETQLNLQTIQSSSISVTEPDGQTVVTGTLVSAVPDDAGNPKHVVATYSIGAPGGLWDSADNGAYSVTLAAGAVADAAGNLVGAGSGSFNVNVAAPPPAPPPPVSPPPVSPPPVSPPPPPADVTAPTAAITPPADIISAGGKNATISVAYDDNALMNPGSIVTGNLVVQRNGESVKVTGVKFNISASADAIVANYTIAAPGGSWDSADNGTYSISLSHQNRATDASGNLAGDASASFVVNIEPPAPPPAPPPPPVVLAAPTAAISPVANVTAAGSTNQTITVTYTDSDGVVNAGSIGASDLVVTDGNGNPVAVTGVSIQPPNDASKITAVYTIAAPGSSWDSADNGVYTVTLKNGEVQDNDGLAAAGLSTSFNVNVPVPQPVIDDHFSGGTPVNTGFVAETAVGTSDGELLVGGRQGDLSSGGSQYVLKRLNADGSVDSSFGRGGVVASDLGLNAAAFAIATDVNGSIYLAGTQNGNLAVWKFKSSGGLDGHFGDHGTVLVDLGSTDQAYGIALAPDGSVVVVGSSGDQYAIVKLTASGDLDDGFGMAGSVVGATDSPSVLSSVAIMGDGRVVTAGSIGGSTATFRFLTNGERDNSFGGNGQINVPGLDARTDLGQADHTAGVALEGDKVLVCNRSGGDFAVARLNADGSLDSSFDGGVATVDFGGDDDADQVIVQASGEIFVLGTTQVVGQDPRIGVAVLQDNGSLDTSFGTGGKATLDTGLGADGRALHIGDLVVRAFGSAQQNGQLVVGTGSGESNQPQQTPANTGLRRLNVPGAGKLGDFGLVSGKNHKLSFLDSDGSRITVTLKGSGTGKALYDGSEVDIILSGTSSNTSVSVKVRGGDGLFSVRNITADAGLRAFSAKGATVSGAFTVPGYLGRADLRSLQGTLAASGGIGQLNFSGDLKNAVILAGASLGANGVVGGVGVDADTFNAGSIGSVKVGGAIRSTLIGAGFSSSNGVIFDSDDTVVDPANSKIGSISAHGGLDANSRIMAGGIGKAKVPSRIDLSKPDARFVIVA